MQWPCLHAFHGNSEVQYFGKARGSVYYDVAHHQLAQHTEQPQQGQKHQRDRWHSKTTSSSKKRVGEAATARCLFSLPDGVRELTEEARTATGVSALATATLSLLIPCRSKIKHSDICKNVTT